MIPRSKRCYCGAKCSVTVLKCVTLTVSMMMMMMMMCSVKRRRMRAERWAVRRAASLRLRVTSTATQCTPPTHSTHRWLGYTHSLPISTHSTTISSSSSICCTVTRLSASLLTSIVITFCQISCNECQCHCRLM